MDQKQIADRAQFRRYAEAALAGMDIPPDYSKGPCNGAISDRAFELASRMMLAEGQAFERYEILALEAITADERARHAEGS